MTESGPPFDVRRIVVLRGGGIGDLIFAVPALRALAARYPSAAISLVGVAPHAALVAAPRGPVDEIITMPAAAVDALRGEPTLDAGELEAFCASLRAHRFDLAVQLHGGGAASNPLVRRFGARWSIGLGASGAPPLDATLPYVYWQPEVARALEVVALVGAEPVELEPRLEVTGEDLREAQLALDEFGTRRGDDDSDRRSMVVLVPGAGDPRRRWPAARFGEVARGVADETEVVIVGGAGDAPLAGEIVVARPSAIDLTGRLSLPGLAGLLSRADLVIGNDSGPLHLAAAVGAPIVGIFWCGNLINAGRLFRSRYRPLLSWQLECPECGTNCMTGGCDHQASFVADVPTEAVLEAVSALGEEGGQRPRRVDGAIGDGRRDLEVVGP